MFVAHTSRVKLEAGDPELLNIPMPTHAEKHCWVIIPVTE